MLNYLHLRIVISCHLREFHLVDLCGMCRGPDFSVWAFVVVVEESEVKEIVVLCLFLFWLAVIGNYG